MSLLAQAAALALLSSVAAYFLTPWLRDRTAALGIFAASGGRHVHVGRVPIGGGIAIAAALVLSLAIAALVGIDWYSVLKAAEWPLVTLFVGAVTILVGGICDDLFGLSPAAKLAFQVAAALIAVGGGFHFSAVSNPFAAGAWHLAPIGVVMTVGWILIVTNAINLIDGLDGLAAGVALIASLTLLICSAAYERPDAMLLFALLAGALSGFLPYNFSPATVFLGDSGSQLIGYLLSLLSIHSMQKGTATVVVLVPTLALGIPLLETVVTVLRRIVESGAVSVLRADRDHIHHRLVGMGLTQRRAVLILYAACVFLGALAYLAVMTHGTFDAIIVAGVALAMLLAMRRLGYTHRGPRRSSLAGGGSVSLGRTATEVDMIKIGDTAPEFEGVLGNGKPFRSKDFKGRRHLVLYFFPKDFTPGCTKEACSFRDRRPEIAALDGEVVGVSYDDSDKHAAFADKYNLPYPLVSDSDVKIASAFGVSRLGGWLPTRRVTFVIDKHGVVRDIVQSEFNIDLHIDQALKTLQQLQR